MNAQPSQQPKGEGRKIRRARNIVKRMQHAYERGDIYLPGSTKEAYWVARYLRARALLAQHLLIN